MERGRQVDPRSRGRGAASDALPRRSCERVPGALEGTLPPGPGGVRGVRSGPEGGLRNAGLPVLCLQLLYRYGESPDYGVREIVVEVKRLRIPYGNPT